MHLRQRNSGFLSGTMATTAMDVASALGTATSTVFNAVKPSSRIAGWRSAVALAKSNSFEHHMSDDMDDNITLVSNGDNSHNDHCAPHLSPADLYEAASRLSRAAEAAANGDQEMAHIQYCAGLANTISAASDDQGNWYPDISHKMQDNALKAMGNEAANVNFNDALLMQQSNSELLDGYNLRYQGSDASLRSSTSSATNDSYETKEAPKQNLSLAQAIMDVMIALAIFIRQSPIPDACQAIIEACWHTIVQLDATLELRKRAIQMLVHSMYFFIELDRKHHLMAKMGQMATTLFSAFSAALQAYNNTTPYSELQKIMIIEAQQLLPLYDFRLVFYNIIYK
ncbi:hypothetical protein BDF19DRAFT_424083 [Syncephalis fuscata]|nr:hypothetical protein BDF19DRAFT_424083 [Syncephalis fuscata]